MNRRDLIAGLAASGLAGLPTQGASVPNTYLEIKTWRLHTTPEEQGARVADFLSNGLSPALAKSGAKLAGAFANVIGEGGPYYVTLTAYGSLAAMQETLTKLENDGEYQRQVDKLGAGNGLPFVRVESSLLRSFDVMPEPLLTPESDKQPPRVFELRTYESQTFATLKRKVGMFNNGEAQIFERLGLRPVFFGETVVGPRQPNLMYMLSYDDLAQHDRLWHDFGNDPAWKKLSSTPELKDAEIVANISNVILRPLPFSLIR
jgi:NIPSNAP